MGPAAGGVPIVPVVDQYLDIDAAPLGGNECAHDGLRRKQTAGQPDRVVVADYVKRPLTIAARGLSLVPERC